MLLQAFFVCWFGSFSSAAASFAAFECRCRFGNKFDVEVFISRKNPVRGTGFFLHHPPAYFMNGKDYFMAFIICS
jgi:hypothetical protein